MNTIQEMRSHNFKVTVHHYRTVASFIKREVYPYNKTTRTFLTPRGERQYNVAGKGGKTVVYLSHPTIPGTTFIGSATCADVDNFDRKRGNMIALGRAIKTMNVCLAPVQRQPDMMDYMLSHALIAKGK